MHGFKKFPLKKNGFFIIKKVFESAFNSNKKRFPLSFLEERYNVVLYSWQTGTQIFTTRKIYARFMRMHAVIINSMSLLKGNCEKIS
jgi:hypothetical protein